MEGGSDRSHLGREGRIGRFSHNSPFSSRGRGKGRGEFLFFTNVTGRVRGRVEGIGKKKGSFLIITTVLCKGKEGGRGKKFLHGL